MRRLLPLGLLLVVLAGTSLAAPGAPHALAATTDVSVQDNKYVPPSVTINVGDTVHWTWAGLSFHTVTATDMSFDSGAPQTSGTFDHTFNSAGTFTYFCQVHGAAIMSGTVVVQQAATATTQPAASATSAPASTSTTAAGATSTSAAGSSATTVAAASATPRPQATIFGTVITPSAPRAAGRSAAGAQLPRSGTGAPEARTPLRNVLLVVLALAGVSSIVMALAVRRRA